MDSTAAAAEVDNPLSSAMLPAEAATPSPLSATERLLLLQAVYREGASGPAFEAVSRLLLAHPATNGRQRSSLSPAVRF